MKNVICQLRRQRSQPLRRSLQRYWNTMDRFSVSKMKDEWIDWFCREALPRIREIFQPERVIVFGFRVGGGA